jgi:CRISPR-associated protein Cas1
MYILPLKHRKPILYLTSCRVLTNDYKVYARDKDGDKQLLPNSFGCIMLGLGTNITHGAVRCFANHNTPILWVSSTRGKLNSTSINYYGALFKRQLELYKHNDIDIGRKLLQKRFGKIGSKYNTRASLMGYEGLNMVREYQRLAKKYNVENFIRDGGDNDIINRHINILNSYLYGIIEAIIYAMRCCPHIGYIHSGDKAFVYDLADIFKINTSIDFAFKCRHNPNILEVRSEFIEHLNYIKITKDISGLILELFSNGGGENK